MTRRARSKKARIKSLSGIRVGTRIPWGYYKDAVVRQVFKNGWCRCKWKNGRMFFSARISWLLWGDPLNRMQW